MKSEKKKKLNSIKDLRLKMMRFFIGFYFLRIAVAVAVSVLAFSFSFEMLAVVLNESRFP